MAPLKLRYGQGEGHHSASYPCLKGHGPIEATKERFHFSGLSMYPCLKGHGPIEAIIYRTVPPVGERIHA